LVAAGHDVVRFDVAVHETFAVKIGEDVQGGLKHRTRFVRRERPFGKNLCKVLLGTLHYDIDEGHPAKLEASHFIEGKQMRMRQLSCLLPTRKLEFAIFWSCRNKFDSGFYKTLTLMALCEE
jgi:hypothetical protein